MRSVLVRCGFVVLVTACVSRQQARPHVAAELTPAATQELALAVDARGVQHYSCDGHAWTLVGPEAELFDGERAIGTHFAGPTWKLSDGSSVVGKKVAARTVDAAAIPWLLLEVTNHQVEPGVAGCIGFEATQVALRRLGLGQVIGNEPAARRGGTPRPLQLAEVRDHTEATFLVETEPGTAGAHVAAGENPRRRRPLAEGFRQALVVFVSIRRQNEPIARMRTPRENEQAHVSWLPALMRPTGASARW